jgi:hypothetical protein
VVTRYRQASPPAHGGIRLAGGTRPWSREERVLSRMERAEPVLRRLAWLGLALGGLYVAGHVAVSL